MTKKHLVKLAETIRVIADDSLRRLMADRIGWVCAESNSRFNWGIWNRACGVNT